MIVSKEEFMSEYPLAIDLTGPDGNAFVLLGFAKTFSKKLKEKLMLLHGVTWEEIQKEMTASDYENLIQVFDKYFGECCVLLR